ncbi:hypothetical protein OG535_36425 [Kitasatospora sp. NBC_00085]|uniref:hypothetical protein n=1 Tax=unclassified Kitasatospora TaxID=2633591 RepID=UPI003243C937
MAAAPDRFARLHDQAAGLLALWAEATHRDKEKTGLPALQDRARTTTDRERADTVKQCEQGSD